MPIVSSIRCTHNYCYAIRTFSELWIKKLQKDSIPIQFQTYLRLPDDVIGHIFGRVTSVEDRLHLGAVCRQYQRVMMLTSSWPDKVDVRITAGLTKSVSQSVQQLLSQSVSQSVNQSVSSTVRQFNNSRWRDFESYCLAEQKKCKFTFAINNDFNACSLTGQYRFEVS